MQHGQSMPYLDRPYDDDAGDFARLWDFLVRDYTERDGDVTWTVGRLADWKFNLASSRKRAGPFTSRSAHLWLDDGGALAAFAISENLDEDICVVVRHDIDDLFGAVLDSCAEHWRGFGQPWDEAADGPSTDPEAPQRRLVIETRESGRREAEVLAGHGWRPLGRRATTRRFDVSAKAREPISLPDGFRLVSMAEDPNFASKVEIYHDAWHAGKPVTQEDLDVHAYCRTAPTYSPELDISVVAPGGEHVAGATAFVDVANSCAEIERVATRSDYRRRGLATAAIGGCLRALDNTGIRYATITGYSEDAIRLYGQLGAISERHSTAWQIVIPRA